MEVAKALGGSFKLVTPAPKPVRLSMNFQIKTPVVSLLTVLGTTRAHSKYTVVLSCLRGPFARVSSSLPVLTISPPQIDYAADCRAGLAVYGPHKIFHESEIVMN